MGRGERVYFLLVVCALILRSFQATRGKSGGEKHEKFVVCSSSLSILLDEFNRGAALKVHALVTFIVREFSRSGNRASLELRISETKINKNGF